MLPCEHHIQSPVSNRLSSGHNKVFQHLLGKKKKSLLHYSHPYLQLCCARPTKRAQSSPTHTCTHASFCANTNKYPYPGFYQEKLADEANPTTASWNISQAILQLCRSFFCCHRTVTSWSSFLFSASFQLTALKITYFQDRVQVHLWQHPFWPCWLRLTDKSHISVDHF